MSQRARAAEPIDATVGRAFPSIAEAGRNHTGDGAARREMAVALAALFAAGGSLSLLSLAFPRWTDLEPLGVVAPAVLAIVTAALLLRFGARLPMAGFHVAVALGTGCIGTAVHFGGGSARAIYSPYFVWVALYAFFFFRTRAAWGHVALASAVLLVTLLAAESNAAGPVWLVNTGTAAVTGLVVSTLVRRIRELATTDPLTGLANRRAWNDTLDVEVARAAREAGHLSVAIMDLDGLKQINDQRGHAAGDEAIIRVTHIWRSHIRSGDLLARLGGDEFGLMLADCPTADAQLLLQRIRRASSTPSVSCGLATLTEDDSAQSLVARADLALNQAKQEGRNRVVLAEVPAS